jgi:hypothetical protein
MPRSFDLVVDSSSSVEQFHSAFGDEEYWRTRLEAMDNGTLESLTLDDDGTVRVRTTFRLLSAELPKVVTKLRGGNWELAHTEMWSPIAGGRVRGEVTVDLNGVPLSARGAGLLTPVVDGSQLTYTATVAVRVPLLGGAVESLIGNQLTTWIREIQTFTTEWIDQHGDLPG